MKLKKNRDTVIESLKKAFDDKSINKIVIILFFFQKKIV